MPALASEAVVTEEPAQCGSANLQDRPELCRLEAVSGELVSVEIADISSIGAGVPTARSNRTFILAARCQSGLVEFPDCRAARRDKAYRAAIGKSRRMSVRRLQDEKFRRRLAPDRAVLSQIVQTLVAECAQHPVIKGARLCKIVRSHRDMREY